MALVIVARCSIALPTSRRVILLCSALLEELEANLLSLLISGLLLSRSDQSQAKLRAALLLVLGHTRMVTLNLKLRLRVPRDGHRPSTLVSAKRALRAQKQKRDT
jgi:hypothetical protein